MKTEFDVAVVGGGPAGCATALALSRRGYATVIIERCDYKDIRIGETFPPAVKKLLASLGVWEQFISQHHSPSFGVRSVWGHHELYYNDFIFNPYGTGWHVDRARFDAMLANAAQRAGVSVQQDAQVTSCAEDAMANWQIGVMCGDRQREFRAKFLADASGRASLLACRMGATRTTYDRLVGVISFLSPSVSGKSGGNYTLIEAVEDGWWYSALLPDSYMVTAFMTDADLYARNRRRSANYCQEQLYKAVHTRARTFPYFPVSKNVVVAANSSRLDRIAGKNWLAVGDAAMTFDPLSSQGVYKALESGLAAAQAIQRCSSANNMALEDYAARIGRDFHNYLRIRGAYYFKEQRWPTSVFWQRRHAAHASLSHHGI